MNLIGPKWGLTEVSNSGISTKCIANYTIGCSHASHVTSQHVMHHTIHCYYSRTTTFATHNAGKYLLMLLLPTLMLTIAMLPHSSHKHHPATCINDSTTTPGWWLQCVNDADYHHHAICIDDAATTTLHLRWHNCKHLPSMLSMTTMITVDHVATSLPSTSMTITIIINHAATTLPLWQWQW